VSASDREKKRTVIAVRRLFLIWIKTKNKGNIIPIALVFDPFQSKDRQAYCLKNTTAIGMSM
jgi:hypothetical protein